MELDFDDPIAKREKREAEAILSDPVDKLGVSEVKDDQKEPIDQINDIMSVLDTVDKESNKKYKK